MTLERNDIREISFTCDTCGDELDTFETDFDEARGELKSEGWRTYKEGGDWLHSCEECTKEWAANQGSDPLWPL